MKCGLEGNMQELITFNRGIYFSCELESSAPTCTNPGVISPSLFIGRDKNFLDDKIDG
jgi:hypothetical protein